MLDDSLASALARTGFATRQRATQLLGAVGLHPGQEILLAILTREGPCAIGELAEHLRVEQPTVTKMVRRMCAVGLLERGADPADGRRTLVRLTDLGRETHVRAAEVWRTFDALATADLGPDEVDLLKDLLARVRASLRAGDGAADGPPCAGGGAGDD